MAEKQAEQLAETIYRLKIRQKLENNQIMHIFRRIIEIVEKENRTPTNEEYTQILEEIKKI